MGRNNFWNLVVWQTLCLLLMWPQQTASQDLSLSPNSDDLKKLRTELEQISRNTTLLNSVSEAARLILGNPIVMRAIRQLGLVDIQNLHGQSLLTLAAQEGLIDVMKIILKTGAFVDLTDELGATSLIWAAYRNRTDVVRLLIQHGADVNIRSRSDGNTALHWAAFNQNLDVTRDLLAAGAITSLTNWGGNTALLSAAAYLGPGDSVGVVTELLQDPLTDVDHHGKDGRTALTWASMADKVDVVRSLLEAGANPDLQDGVNGATALDYAVFYGHTEVVKELLGAKAVLHLRNTVGYPPLLIASLNNRLTATELLLTAGADINGRGEDGDTALMKAVLRGNTDMMQLLLEHCPDLSIINNNEKNATVIALQSGNFGIQKMLQEHNSKTCSHEGRTYEVGNTRYDNCHQLKCCHGTWALTGEVLPSCGVKCKTAVALAGYCNIINKCQPLLDEFQKNDAIAGGMPLTSFIRRNNCGFKDGVLSVCCPRS